MIFNNIQQRRCLFKLEKSAKVMSRKNARVVFARIANMAPTFKPLLPLLLLLPLLPLLHSESCFPWCYFNLHTNCFLYRL